MTSWNPQTINPDPAHKLSVTNSAPAAPDPANVGQWSRIIPLANVPIHTHVLATGEVLFWGRRHPPGSMPRIAAFSMMMQFAPLLILPPPSPMRRAPYRIGFLAQLSRRRIPWRRVPPKRTPLFLDVYSHE